MMRRPDLPVRDGARNHTDFRQFVPKHLDAQMLAVRVGLGLGATGRIVFLSCRRSTMQAFAIGPPNGCSMIGRVRNCLRSIIPVCGLLKPQAIKDLRGD